MSSEPKGPGPGHGVGPYREEDLLPVSGLAHLVFCPRRWALIHLEGQWADNLHTVQGTRVHETVHTEGGSSRDGVIQARSLRLRSLRLGVAGVSDVVEFHALAPGEDAALGCALPGRDGLWRPVPVEHKKGRPQPDDCYHVQLAAQALCLEEMTGALVPLGYLFHATPRRRQAVEVDAALRRRTRELAAEMHAMHGKGQTPPARYHKKCKGCSMLDVCQPRTAGRGKSASRYLSAGLTQLARGDPT